MSQFAKGYNTEQVVKENELIIALKNYEATYGTEALNELLEKAKRK